MTRLNEEAIPVRRLALTAKLPVQTLCFNASAAGVLAGQLYTNPALTYLPLDEDKDALRVLVPRPPAPRKEKYAVMEVACLAEEVLYVETLASDERAYYSWNSQTDHTSLLALVQPRFHGGRTIASGRPSLLLPSAEPVIYDVRHRVATQSVPMLPLVEPWISLDDEEHIFVGQARSNTICRVRLHDGDITQRYEVADTGAGVGFVASTSRYCYAHGQFYTGLYVWDKLTGAPLSSATFQDPDSLVLSVAMSTDETKLAVGSRAGYVTIYAVPSGETLYCHRLHAGRVSALAFSADSALLASGGPNGDICVIRLP